MIAWVLAAGACLLSGLAATWFLQAKRLPRERRIAGRALLASLDHADFMQLVLAVLNGRGYERTFGGGGTEGEYLVERHGRGWLLSSKYSHAYTPDSTAIAEFSNYLRHRGVPGGVLAITGRFPRAAFGVARAHRVELLDSSNMWDELQPLFDERQQAAIEGPARARLKWQFLLAWLAAVAIGVAVFLALHKPVAPAAVAGGASTAAGATGAAPAPAQPRTGINPSPPAAKPTRATPAAAPGATVEQRRRAIAEAIQKLPHVRSAAWPADSTLQVLVDSDLFDPRARLCPILEPDPDLGASRLQVQYPASAHRPVRFLQCRPY